MVARYRLGNKLHRWVLRSLRYLGDADLYQTHKEVCARLHNEGIVLHFEFPPSEEDVWCSLKYLVAKRYVDMYLYDKTPSERVIRYRVNVMH